MGSDSHHWESNLQPPNRHQVSFATTLTVLVMFEEENLSYYHYTQYGSVIMVMVNRSTLHHQTTRIYRFTPYY